jgi:hypothetical protein
MITGSAADSLAFILVLGIWFGSIVLVILVARVRRSLGWGASSLGVILTEGMLAFVTAIVLAIGVILARVLGYLQSADGTTVARFTNLVLFFFATWIGVLRMLYWYLFKGGVTQGPLSDQPAIDDEIIRLRLLLDEYMRESAQQRLADPVSMAVAMRREEAARKLAAELAEATRVKAEALALATLVEAEAAASPREVTIVGASEPVPVHVVGDEKEGETR